MRPRRRPRSPDANRFAMRAPRIERHLRAGEVEVPKIREDWQPDAYAYAQVVGEVNYALGLKGNTLARCRLRPEVRVPGSVDEWEECEDARVLRVHNALRPPLGGQGALLSSALHHLDIAGEAWLYGVAVRDLAGQDAGLVWEFLSVLEVEIKDSGGQGRPAKVSRNAWGGSKGKEPVEQNAYLARLHRAAPDYSQRAKSPMQGVLTVLKQIVLLTQVIDAIAQSRLTANMLYVPWEVSLGPTDEFANPGAEDEYAGQSIDEFEQELREHLTAPITDRSAESSLIPLLMRGPALVDGHPTKDLIGIIDLARQLDDKFQGLRTEALNRLAAGLDIPPEIMQGKGSLSGLGGGNVAECVDDSTEILTIDGWRRHEDIQVGDLVLTLNHDTGVSEWHPLRKINRFTGRRDLLAIDGDRHSSLSTLNHRWPVLKQVRENVTGKNADPCCVDGCAKPTLALGLCSLHYQARRAGADLPTRKGVRSAHSSRVVGRQREWATSADLRTHHDLIVAAPHGEHPTEPKWSDAFVELVGWAWTEGAVELGPRQNTARVRIYQSERANPHKVARIRAALIAAFGPETANLNGRTSSGRPSGNDDTPRWQYRDRPGPRYSNTGEFRLNAAASRALLAAFSDPSRKIVSQGFVRSLTAAQLELFIDSSIAGDGWTVPAGTLYISQTDPDRLAAIELAAILSGRSTNIYRSHEGGPVTITDDDGGVRRYETSAPQTTLSISRKTTFTLGRKNRHTVEYDGTVWCPTVCNGTWYARRNGKTFITGNSIDAEFIEKHVIPPGELIAEFLTVAYLRPMLQQFEGLTGPETDWFRYSLDTSAITADPDRSASATAGRQMGIISDEAWLAANGFADADAIDPDIAFQRKMLELSAAAPTILAPFLLPLAFPDRPEIVAAMVKAAAAYNSPIPKPAVVPGGTPGIPPAPVAPEPDKIPSDSPAVSPDALTVDRILAGLNGSPHG